jgi:hypothetical protein
LRANDPGSNTQCGGEVQSRVVVDPINHPDWPGWWKIVVAQDPPQDDPSGTANGIVATVLQGIAQGVGDVVTGLIFQVFLGGRPEPATIEREISAFDLST